MGAAGGPHRLCGKWKGVALISHVFSFLPLLVVESCLFLGWMLIGWCTVGTVMGIAVKRSTGLGLQRGARRTK